MVCAFLKFQILFKLFLLGEFAEMGVKRYFSFSLHHKKWIHTNNWTG